MTRLLMGFFLIAQVWGLLLQSLTLMARTKRRRPARRSRKGVMAARRRVRRPTRRSRKGVMGMRRTRKIGPGRRGRKFRR